MSATAGSDAAMNPAVSASLSANGGGGMTATSELRLRRVKSTSRAQEIVTEDEKQRRAQPDKP